MYIQTILVGCIRHNCNYYSLCREQLCLYLRSWRDHAGSRPHLPSRRSGRTTSPPPLAVLGLAARVSRMTRGTLRLQMTILIHRWLQGTMWTKTLWRLAYHFSYRRFNLRHKIGHVRNVTECSRHFWWQNRTCSIYESESVAFSLQSSKLAKLFQPKSYLTMALEALTT